MSATAVRANGHLSAAHHDGGDARDGSALPGATDVLHGSLRGVIAAMAMTGMRAFTVNAGLVQEPPPKAMVDSRGLLRLVPKAQRRAAIELAHWSYGAQGGAAFGLLPDGVRRRVWSGPAFGALLWLGFELAIAPVLGLKHAKSPRPVERAAILADHLLYGFVLSQMPGGRSRD